MKITKYLHSCLLIEEKDTVILIDPGNFTYNAKVFPLQEIIKIDYVLITHEHPDHCYPPFISELVAKFPDLKVIGNDSVVKFLKENNIVATTNLPEFITAQPVPHEDVVVAVPPENTQYTLFSKFTDPGDSHHVRETANIFALPMQAPWGSFADALKLAEELNPKYVIPVHDWHWKDEVRKGMYQRSIEYLSQSDIQLKPLEVGESVTIEE